MHSRVWWWINTEIMDALFLESEYRHRFGLPAVVVIIFTEDIVHKPFSSLSLCLYDSLIITERDEIGKQNQVYELT